MAVSGDKTINSSISASSSVQTWQWNQGHQNYFIQNLTIGTNTATDTALYFDTLTAIDTASTTAIQLQAGQSISMNFPGPTSGMSFYSTGTVHYQVFFK
jgi:hypothetical protein